jgi:glutamate-1-semialdehyde aminotransferase
MLEESTARDTTKTQSLFQRAKKVLPYAVGSNFRYWDDEATLVVARGEVPYLWDAEGIGT